MARPLVFFSDVHLGAPSLDDDREREQHVIQFLEQAMLQDAETYIVGDLFDFWFEYRHAIPRANIAMVAALKSLTASGLRLHYLAGNHDLWIGDFFRDDLGIQIHHNALKIETPHHRIYVSHGDGAAPSDRGYRFLKRILQSRLNIFLYRLLHPDLGIPLAKHLSQVSRDKGRLPNPWEQEYRQFAHDRFAEGHDVVIMGHTHYPMHEITGGKHYLNLGDWITHFTYCRIDNAEISLRQWPSEEPWRPAKVEQDALVHTR